MRKKKHTSKLATPIDPLQATNLVRWVWKRGNMLSLPLLIAQLA